MEEVVVDGDDAGVGEGFEGFGEEEDFAAGVGVVTDGGEVGFAGGVVDGDEAVGLEGLLEVGVFGGVGEEEVDFGGAALLDDGGEADLFHGLFAVGGADSEGAFEGGRGRRVYRAG